MKSKSFYIAISEDGDTIEVRCLDCKENRQQDIREGSIREDFLNNRDLAAAAIRFNVRPMHGCLFIPEPNYREIVSPFSLKITLTAWKEGDGTEMVTVTARRWLLIDCDFGTTS